jgi:hypothetical protein
VGRLPFLGSSCWHAKHDVSGAPHSIASVAAEAEERLAKLTKARQHSDADKLDRYLDKALGTSGYAFPDVTSAPRPYRRLGAYPEDGPIVWSPSVTRSMAWCRSTTPQCTRNLCLTRSGSICPIFGVVGADAGSGQTQTEVPRRKLHGTGRQRHSLKPATAD